MRNKIKYLWPKRCIWHRLGPLGRRWQAYVACLLSEKDSTPARSRTRGWVDVDLKKTLTLPIVTDDDGCDGG